MGIINKMENRQSGNFFVLLCFVCLFVCFGGDVTYLSEIASSSFYSIGLVRDWENDFD